MSHLKQNVSSYLIQRLYDYGVRHVFGVPGDFVLGFYHELINQINLRLLIHVMNKEQDLLQMHMLELMD